MGRLQGELVSATTNDQLRLDGFFHHSDLPPATPFDSAIITHGLGSNFYGSRLLKYFAEVLSELGISSVLGNTRGHDHVAIAAKAGRATTVGAAFESVDDCCFDLLAWSDFMKRR